MDAIRDAREVSQRRPRGELNPRGGEGGGGGGERAGGGGGGGGPPPPTYEVFT